MAYRAILFDLDDTFYRGRQFITACAVLGARRRRAVHVGNDVNTNVRAAQGAGLKTILVARGPSHERDTGADRVVSALVDVTAVAEALRPHA